MPRLLFATRSTSPRRAEEWGYHRFWLAEHHNLPGIASAATSVSIGFVAGGTNRIRVGAGGIMLPNHAPLVIAEQFGTLESIYPGRIDLGLGRARGAISSPLGRYAARSAAVATRFRKMCWSCNRTLNRRRRARRCKPSRVPGLKVPLYLLGSSDFSARLAAELGLPFAFASHFAPDYLEVALALYRRNFKPSIALEKPHAMIGAGVFAAGTDAEAQRLFTSSQLQFLNLLRGQPSKLPPPVESMEGRWSHAERVAVDQRTRCSAVGSAETIRIRLQELLNETGANELIVTAQIFDHTARLRSFEIAARVLREMSDVA